MSEGGKVENKERRKMKNWRDELRKVIKNGTKKGKRQKRTGMRGGWGRKRRET